MIESVNKTEIQSETFEGLVEECANLRAPDPDYIKRADIREFMPQRLSLVKVASDEEIFHISLGYFERLLRKFANVYPENIVKGFNIEDYREGCGVFVGAASFESLEGEKTSNIRVAFRWEGRGEIETTWDSFVEWSQEVND